MNVIMVSGQVPGCADQVLADPSNTQNKYCYISHPPSNSIMLQQQQDHTYKDPTPPLNRKRRHIGISLQCNRSILV